MANTKKKVEPEVKVENVESEVDEALEALEKAKDKNEEDKKFAEDLIAKAKEEAKKNYCRCNERSREDCKRNQRRRCNRRR